jgi:hypothetical protein
MDLTALIAAVRRQTNLTTADVSDADVTAVINEGINEVSSVQRWEFLYSEDTVDTVADTVEANLPTDFRLMDFVERAGKNHGPLIMISFEEYKRRFGDDASSSDDARYFYTRVVDGVQKIGLYPTPNATASDVYNIYYFKSPTVLTTGGTSPEWDTQFHSILVDYATYRLWEREEYFDQIQASFQRYARRLTDMIRFYRMRHRQTRFIIGGGAYYGGHNNPRRHLGFE